MVIKVNNVQMHKNSYGKEVPVVEGKFIMVYDKKTYKDHKDFCDGYPIIISETEKIEVSNWIYDHATKSIEQVKEEEFSEAWSKVLALPEHFSPKHLQAIVDGKMKDGDKVLVECESKASKNLREYNIIPDALSPNNISNIIEFNPYITIFPKEETLDSLLTEFELEAKSNERGISAFNFKCWLERNGYKISKIK